jgi:hypothetical protein
MKIAEIRVIIDKYSQDQLKNIVTQLYKVIPKAIREENDVDGILNNPDKANRTKARVKELPDIDELESQTDLFIENAQNQYYMIPNRVISRQDRPKWRFVVKRLYQDILLAAGKEENIAQAARLTEKLYILLCNSCDEMLFSAYDSFQSVGIEQAEFFRKVLLLKSQCTAQNVFVKDAILLIINHSLNRYTLYDYLIKVLTEFLKTPDLRELAIETCNEIRDSIKKEPQDKKKTFREKDYKKEKKLNNLAITGFYCYTQLFEYEKAIDYFKRNYHAKDEEISLYILLEHLYGLNQKEHFLEEYQKALKQGIKPRDMLVKLYKYVKTRGELPEYFGVY